MGRLTENRWLDRFFTAGVSLVGVVVGAVLAVSTSLYIEERRETREFNEAVRVIDDELATNAFQLWGLYDEDEIPTSIGHSPEGWFPTDAWTDYRGSVARLASERAWDELTRAYFSLRVMGPFLRNLEPGTPLRSSYKARIYEVCHETQIAREWLRGRLPAFSKVGCEGDR